MTDEASVSDLRAFVGSLELVVSSLVLTHHDKAQLASRLVEVAHLIHGSGVGATPGVVQRHEADYEVVMSFARLAQHSLDNEYQRAEPSEPPAKISKSTRARHK